MHSIMVIDNAPTPAREHPLKFFINIASLENLAATSLALDLWHHNQLGHFLMPRANFKSPNFKCEQVLRVSLPRNTMKLIKTRIRSVGLEVNSLYHNFAGIGNFYDLCTFVKYFDSFTYGPDGEICPERTAKNLSTRNDLTQWEKFQIACAYCLEDEIRQIWPNITEPLDKKKIGLSVLFSFVCYWKSKMQNCSTDSVPKVPYYELQRMFVAAKDFGNWTAAVNVLNELTADQQYDSIRTLATQDDSGFKNLLPKLNEIQVDHILSNFPIRIISRLALQKGGFEYAIKIWNFIRNKIRTKSFAEIIRYLWKHAYHADKYEHKLLIRTQAQAILLEMWITAREELKIEFINQDGKVEGLFKYLSKIEEFCYHRLDNDINFISRLFSDLPMEMRFRIWRQYWTLIVFFSPPRMLKHLISLGVTNSDYRKFVEEEMMDYEKVGFIISNWLEGRMIYSVINYTKLCSWNEQLVRNFRKIIFFRNVKSNYFSFDEVIKIGAVIDNSLPNVEAGEAKRFFLYSGNVHTLFRLKLEEGLAMEAISMIDRFLPIERSVREKELFLDHWRKFLTFDKHPHNPVIYQRWSEFLHWWVGDGSISSSHIFKQFLPVDQVFEELLLKAMPTLEIRFGALGKEISEPVPSSIDKLEEFAGVDEFLMWYFGNEEEVKNFKRNKISNYQNIVELNDLLSSSNESIVNRVIAWFFNYNIIEVGQFKNEFDKKDLLN